MATDLETTKEMLERASIEFTEELASTLRPSRTIEELPVGSIIVKVGDYPLKQPFDGGYPGFFTDLVFGPEGALLAVWAWE